MATRLSTVLMGTFPHLRYEPTAKRIRASLDGTAVVDTLRAYLIWEPRRITPVYAVPEQELLAGLDLAGYVTLDFPAFDWLEDDGEIIVHPRDPFHRVDIRGSSVDVEVPPTA